MNIKNILDIQQSLDEAVTSAHMPKDTIQDEAESVHVLITKGVLTPYQLFIWVRGLIKAHDAELREDFVKDLISIGALDTAGNIDELIEKYKNEPKA